VLSGYVAIPNLLATYAERIDAGDFKGLAELFTHAQITTEGGPDPIFGAEEALAMYERWTRRFPDNGTPHSHHVTTNIILDVDDEAGTATSRSYFTVFMRTDTLPLQPIIAGRYHDSFERVDGTWRFTHRHMFSDHLGDLSEHMLGDPFTDHA
jgi:hypothetical protein